MNVIVPVRNRIYSPYRNAVCESGVTIQTIVRERATGRLIGILKPVSLSDETASLLGNWCEPDQKITHYMRASYFMSLVREKQLTMKRLDQYVDDPEEGTIPGEDAIGIDPIMIALGANREFRDSQRAAIELMRRRSYVHCWFGQVSEDPYMWWHYGDRGRGVRLQSTVARLKGSLAENASGINVKK